MRANVRRIVEATSRSVQALSVIASLAVACDHADGDRAEATTPTDLSFLDPLTNGQDVRALFEVETDDAEYWRILTLDRYDGETWTGANMDGSDGVSLSLPASLPPSGNDLSNHGLSLRQTFRIRGALSGQHALPMAQRAEQISGSFEDVTWDAAGSQAFVESDLSPGTTYTVRSRIVVPTPQDLDDSELAEPPPGATFNDPWIALPHDLDPRIAEIAKRWTAHATNHYRKVLAIQQRFQADDFVYSTAVDTAVGDDAIVDFLTRTKAGFCQHYSSAMAVMVRTLGLPARIGVGFRAGTRQTDGTYLVTTNDPHVWVEVWFAGYGWLQFEPEHGTAHPNAQPGTYLNPLPSQ